MSHGGVQHPQALSSFGVNWGRALREVELARSRSVNDSLPGARTGSLHGLPTVLDDPRMAVRFFGNLYEQDEDRVRATAAMILGAFDHDVDLDVDELVQLSIISLAERAGRHGVLVRESGYGVLNARMRHAALDHYRRTACRRRREAPAVEGERSEPSASDAAFEGAECAQDAPRLIAALRQEALECVLEARIAPDRSQRLLPASWRALQHMARPIEARGPLTSAQRQAVSRGSASLRGMVPRAVDAACCQGFAVQHEEPVRACHIVALLRVTRLLDLDLEQLAARSRLGAAGIGQR